MSYLKALRELEQGKTHPVYLLWGKERYLGLEFVRKIKTRLLSLDTADLNCETLNEAFSPEDMVSKALVSPFLAEKRLLIVEGNFLFSLEDHALQSFIDYLKRPSSATCLILLVSEMPVRQNCLYRLIKETGTVIKLEPLKGKELTAWIKKRFSDLGRTVEHAAVEYLALLGSSKGLFFLEQEIKKISLYVASGQTVTKKALEECCSGSLEFNVFQLVDAVGEQDSIKGMQALRQVTASGEPLLKIFFMIGRQLRLLLLAKEFNNPKELAGEGGIPEYAARKVIRQSKNFSAAKIGRAMQELVKADKAFKSGAAKGPVLLEILVLRLCSL